MRTKLSAGVFWRNIGRDRALELKDLWGEIPEDYAPLSGEWAGESIPEIFGSWEEAHAEAEDPFDSSIENSMDAFEAGFWETIAEEARR